MSSGVPVEVSRWIKYLSQLGPTSSNTGLFDEQLINSLKKNWGRFSVDFIGSSR